MSHTSQRRGLDPGHPGKEMIVLAMVPPHLAELPGAGKAMSEVAVKMLEHHPQNWIVKNFTTTDIPDLGPAQKPLEWMNRRRPEATQKFLMAAVGRLSTVVTALYMDLDDVAELLADLKGEWLERNRQRGLPVSVVLSGLFDDVDRLCKRTGSTPHTYLHSLGFFGRVDDLPDETELELVTMCGHGLISLNRIRLLADQVRSGALTAREAGEDLARPCVCGIVNVDRAAEVFTRLARSG